MFTPTKVKKNPEQVKRSIPGNTNAYFYAFYTEKPAKGHPHEWVCTIRNPQWTGM